MKKTSTFFLLLFASIFLQQALNAQCEPAYLKSLDGNQVNAALSNGGDHFWDFSSSPRYEVPIGSGKHSTFASSLWIGGIDQNSSLHVAANNYRQQGNDFFAGPYRTSGNYICDRGFTANGNVFFRGLLTLASGKVAAFYSNGFTVYDPATNTSINRILPVNRNLYQAVELPDGRILLFGDDVYPVKTDAMIVDTSNFNVTLIGQLQHFHKWASTTRLANGQIFIAGVVGCEIFDPATNTSTAVAPMNQQRVKHTAMLLPNGKVLVAGGGSLLSGTGAIPTTEIYDPGANTWTNGPFLNVARNSPESLQLPSGNFLITGGSNTSSNFDVYDPVANTMTPISGWTATFNEHSALLLPGGDILIVTDDFFNTNGRRIGRYDPVNQTVDELSLLITGAQAAYVNPNLALIEREPNRFSEFDLANNVLVDQPWQYMWKITRAEINQFIADFSNNQVNFANYPDIRTWPAHGDTSLGEDLYLAPFVDVNQDGRYRPLQDGDYPCVEGDQALWWVYNDDGQHTQTQGNAMGIQVEQMAYAYNCGSTPCTSDSFLDYTTFHHLEVTNKSSASYEDCYIGVFFDADIGNFADDFIGSDSALGLAFAYNGDPVDENAAGYGNNPPALGSIFLDNGQVDRASNFMYYENDFSFIGNPTQAVHYYNYMRSIWTDGSPLVNDGGDGYGTSNDPLTSYAYTGDPGFCGGPSSGWSEFSAGNIPFDRRYVQSFGPFNLAPGEKIELDFAIIWAQDSSNLSSVCKLKRAAVVVDSFWNAQPTGCFDIVLDKPEPLLPETEVSLYPNPNNGIFRLEFAEPLATDAQLQVLDISGRMVHAQTLPALERNHSVTTRDMAEGVYLVRVTGDQIALTRKMVVRH